MNNFQKVFGADSMQSTYEFFAPGRVNIIGEHIDYNGGWVMPTAISLGINMQVRRRNDSMIVLRSMQFPEFVTLDIRQPWVFEKEHGWANYPKGILQYLLQHDIQMGGAEVLYDSTLPLASGLSSSAALEVVTAFGFMTLWQAVPIDRIALAKLTQQVENQFMDIPCGIMDQFAISMGKAGNALLLDCNCLEYEEIPFSVKDYALVIMNTNKKRRIADSKYRERRGECEAALALLQVRAKNPEVKFLHHSEVIRTDSAVAAAANLSHYSLQDVNLYLEKDTLRRRARHVVTEHQRVLKARKALHQGDLKDLGRLMLASHMSLRDDYEVSCLELDTLVSAAMETGICMGAKMTGAGFGGCAIALVKQSGIQDFIREVGEVYTRKTRLKAHFYECEVVDGVMQLMN